jgi:malate dehydrogenase (oxaloacetate-decarboxylating)
MHDDQHGTAIVTLAGLVNALKITGKKKEEIRVVVNGVGAAGVAITKLFLNYGVKDIVMVDTTGVIYQGRSDGMNPVKEMISNITNTECIWHPESSGCIRGGLAEAVLGRDVFIGVSVAGALNQEMVRTMAKDPIIFALANPTPEIMPEEAKKAGARII